MSRKTILSLMTLCLMGCSAYAQEVNVKQDPVPTAPPIEKIDPALRDLKDAVPWELLAQTLFTREKVYEEKYGLYSFYENPDFPSEVKALDGQEVTVQGYMIPFHDHVYENDEERHEEMHNIFLVAGMRVGPEGEYMGPGSLVVEVHPKEPVKDGGGIVRYRGMMEIVPGSVEARGIYYRLKDAVLVE